jgi:hypothetical protein
MLWRGILSHMLNPLPWGLCVGISGRSLLQSLTSVAPLYVTGQGGERVTVTRTSLCSIEARGSKRLRVACFDSPVGLETQMRFLFPATTGA